MTAPRATTAQLAARCRLERKRLKAASPIIPCWVCGCEPEVDFGLLGAEFSEGAEFVGCQTKFFSDWTPHPSMTAKGIAEWNAMQRCDDKAAQMWGWD
jgi:hypothetical protein